AVVGARGLAAGALAGGTSKGMPLDEGTGDNDARGESSPDGVNGPITSFGVAGPALELEGRDGDEPPAAPRSAAIRGGISSSDGGPIVACVHGASASTTSAGVW